MSSQSKLKLRRIPRKKVIKIQVNYDQIFKQSNNPNFLCLSLMNYKIGLRRLILTMQVAFFLHRSSKSQMYPLMFGSQKFPVYCHMENLIGCGDGGWTLAMKIDGSKVQISSLLLKLVIIEDISMR